MHRPVARPLIALASLVGVAAWPSGAVATPPTQVLILGTPHLRALDERFDPAMLDSTLTALERFAPDAIGVEALSPRTIEAMLADRDAYGQVIDYFAQSAVNAAHAAQDAAGLTPHAARERVEAILSNDQLTPEQRAELVVAFAASYDLPSAALQFTHLEAVDPDAAAALPEPLGAAIRSRVDDQNEIPLVGLELARRLGLERIEPIDDHLDKDDLLRFSDQLQAEVAELPEFAAVQEAPVYAGDASVTDQALDAGDLLPLYRRMNDPARLEADVEAQWGFFRDADLESGRAHARLALWEVRNLNIASHIQRVVARHPGGRVLIVIGAAHKPFLDEYLATMMTVRLRHFAQFAPAGDAPGD